MIAVLRRVCGCVFLLPLFVVCASAQQPDSFPGSDYSTKTGDIVYAVDGEHELLLDLYMPKGVADPPLLVWIHGGAWQRGSKNVVDTIPLVEAGYALASVEFRKSTEEIFPAQIHDIKAAIRYLRGNASNYGYDATRIAIHGRSSGGHLTALVGVTNGHTALEGSLGDFLDESSDVQVVVSYFGASNLNSILAQSTAYGAQMRAPALELLLGGPVEQREALATLASPVSHVDANDPPLLLLHGDQDPQMPINQSHELHGMYKLYGLPAHLEVIHGAEHGGEQFFDEKRTAIVTAFLNDYLR
ncbi:MAG: alpha/beta hydrolase fold domain-containing protein [Candidatus Rariloculaceae bacterium]